ncbi:hypothetical protein AB0C14_16695 [Microbispora hainanensis]|uniref:RNA polymerase sigma factor n=1 Tax=Microbispora hainanensis TaxID=568844 RepID=UPI0033EF1137
MTAPLTGLRSRSELIAELYERHAAGLFAYCHDQLGETASAADAVVAVFTTVPTAEPPSRAALYALGRREIYRRDVSYAMPAVDSVADPATSLIERVFRDIRPHQREVLLLAEVCGLTAHELSVVLDVAADTAEELIAGASRRFAQTLETAVTAARSAPFVPAGVAEVYDAIGVSPLGDVLARLPWRRPSASVRDRVLAALPYDEPGSATTGGEKSSGLVTKRLWPTTPTWPLPLSDPDQVTNTCVVKADAIAQPQGSRRKAKHEATTEPMPRLRGALLSSLGEGRLRRKRAGRSAPPERPAERPAERSAALTAPVEPQASPQTSPQEAAQAAPAGQAAPAAQIAQTTPAAPPPAPEVAPAPEPFDAFGTAPPRTDPFEAFGTAARPFDAFGTSGTPRPAEPFDAFGTAQPTEPFDPFGTPPHPAEPPFDAFGTAQPTEPFDAFGTTPQTSGAPRPEEPLDALFDTLRFAVPFDAFRSADPADASRQSESITGSTTQSTTEPTGVFPTTEAASGFPRIEEPAGEPPLTPPSEALFPAASPASSPAASPVDAFAPAPREAARPAEEPQVEPMESYGARAVEASSTENDVLVHPAVAALSVPRPAAPRRPARRHAGRASGGSGANKSKSTGRSNATRTGTSKSTGNATRKGMNKGTSKSTGNATRKGRRGKGDRHYDWLWEAVGILICLIIALVVFFNVPTVFTP